MNMMPAYSLNVHDMLKHKTLVLTKSAAKHIEEKLLFAQRRMDIIEKTASATTSPEGTEMPFYNTFGSSFWKKYNLMKFIQKFFSLKNDKGQWIGPRWAYAGTSFP